MTKQTLSTILLIAVIGAAGTALAHPGHGEHPGSFAAGLAHPWMGADHLLAMLAVGLWAARLGGKAVWGVPLAFMAAMGMGALLAFGGLAVPFVEPLIAASVLILGLLLAANLALPRVIPFLMAGGFAVLHGMAHGAEAPASALHLEYMTGFLLSTGLIHAGGITLALIIGGANRQRLAGVPIALAGIWLLAGMA
jgi:urease accessory protein